MEAKRRRLETPKHVADTEKSPLIDQLSSSNDKVVLKSLLQLKKDLSSAEDVDGFFSANQAFVSTLLTVTNRYFSNLSLPNDPIKLRVIKECITVLANCCHLSPTVCFKAMQPGLQLALLTVRILESGDRTDVSIKASTLRLIANVCHHTQLAKTIGSISALLDRIMMSIISEYDVISSQALRIVGLLAKSSFLSKKIIESNGCYYLGNHLSKFELANLLQAESLKDVFNSLLEHRPKDVGRQLSNSECIPLFLEVILSQNLPETYSPWIKVMLKLTEHSHEIRESFAILGVIDRALALPRFNGHICEFVCCFAQDAWGRRNLRESGALSKILENLQSSTNIEDQQKIIQSLKSFSHDQHGLSYLCHRSDFVDFLLDVINKFLNANKVECTIEIVEQEIHNRPSSPEFRQLAKRLKETTSFLDNSEQLYKDFFDGASPLSPKNQSPLHRSWSPSISPSSSFSMSPSSSQGSLSPNRDEGIYSGISTSPVHFLLGDDKDLSRDGNEPDDKEKESVENKIIADSIVLLSMLSHQDENHVYLIRENVMSTLIDYISDEKRLNYKLARSTTRLARNSKHLQMLLDMNFHEIVIHKLIRRKCFMTRFAKLCARCEMRRKFGRDLLQEFSSHIDKSLGWSLLQVGLKSSDQKRIDSLISTLILIRTYETRARFLYNYMPIESFISILDGILLVPHNFTLENAGTNMRPEKGSEGFPLCYRVITALSSMISRKTYDEVMEVDGTTPVITDPNVNIETGIQRPENTEPKCVIDQIFENKDIAKLEFRSISNGELVSMVPKKEFCMSNGYFQGMFGNEFAEQLEDRQVFTFDEETENCTMDDFRVFLHYLSGCRSPSDCVRIESVETCISLLYLSDKYLCGQLTEFLLRPNGPAKKMLTGATLKDFIPCILSVNNIQVRLANVAMVVMLRFTTADQLRTTLGQIAGNRVAVDSFLEILRDFLTLCANNTPPHQTSRIWL